MCFLSREPSFSPRQMWTVCYFRRQKKIYEHLHFGADKDKVLRDQTLRNLNKDILLDCISGRL